MSPNGGDRRADLVEVHERRERRIRAGRLRSEDRLAAPVDVDAGRVRTLAAEPTAGAVARRFELRAGEPPREHSDAVGEGLAEGHPGEARVVPDVEIGAVRRAARVAVEARRGRILRGRGGTQAEQPPGVDMAGLAPR